MAEKQKLNELWVLTSFLCCFVVMIHLSSAPVGSLMVGSWQHKLFFMGNKALTFVVPGFIFLSGLKLSYVYRKKDFHIGEFLRKRFLKIFLPYIFWYVAYYALFRDLEFMEHKTLQEHIFSFLLGDIVSPFYFITTICQFYLLFYFILRLFQKCNHMWILIVTAVIEIFYLQYIFVPYEDRFFVTYFIYFVLGCFAAFHLESFQAFLKKYQILIICGYFGFTWWHVTHAYASAYHGVPYAYWRVITCFFAVFAILAFYRFSLMIVTVAPKVLMGFFCQLDRASYGIFLCHSYILYLCSEKWAELGIVSIIGKFIRSTVIVYLVAFLGTVLFLQLKKYVYTRVFIKSKP